MSINFHPKIRRSNVGSDKTYKGFSIDKGSRHCKIKDEEDEVVFRTTNLRDAEKYLDLIEEKDRLERLLEARGVAPHRIYYLDKDVAKTGAIESEQMDEPKEVVIVAKADHGSVVVRHLQDGTEQIVDLEDLEPIQGGSYLQPSGVNMPSVHVVVRDSPKSEEPMSISAFAGPEPAEDRADDWLEMEETEDPEEKYRSVVREEEERQVKVYRSEVTVELEE
jgi:hypothetical protein